MKKLFILAMLASASCLFLTSCDPNKLDPDNIYADASEENIFWGVVGQLVSMNDITPDYQGKTFKPVIGSPENGDESVRVVSLNSLEAAVECFNTLTDAGITETTSVKDWRNSKVGSLTWHLTNDNTSWATVDVSIPAVPSLHKIIYRSPEQGDTNGSVGDNGSAYYRFGDVITRLREDMITEYWICVRPAFGPEGKGDAHFVCVSPLPEKNIWPYNSTKAEQAGKPWKASNRMEYAFPDNIGKETKWMQDFAELLYAITYPTNWYTNVTNYSKTGTFGSPSGLPIFKDFHVGNIKYHNEAFWQNVQKMWKEKGIVERAMGISYEDLEYALRPIDPGTQQAGRGITFLYYGYGWSTSISNKPKLYEITYTHGSGNEEKNLHVETKKTVQSQVVVPNTYEESNTNYPFNIKTETSQLKPYIVKQKFFSDENPRWIIRYATGEQLSTTGNFNNQQPIPGFTGNEELYRYYKDVAPDHNLTSEPEVTEKAMLVNDKNSQNLTAFSGTAHYHLGDVLRDQNGHKWFVVKPSGNKDGVFPENSPYSELVSFDGITYSADGRTATNIVTKNQALRVMPFIWLLSKESQNQYGIGTIQKIHDDIKNNANVTLEHLVQSVYVPVYGEKNDKDKGFSWSAAYYEAGSTSQHLLRFVITTNKLAEHLSVMYDKYPSQNIVAENVYLDKNAAAFNGSPYIYLQDVADAQKVTQYGEDLVAKSPLYSDANAPRAHRTAAENRAGQVNNYQYNMNSWANNQQPLGMWNEPVLLMRATALYDRGPSEYATVSHDGLQFTLLSHGQMNNPYLENQYNYLNNVFDENDAAHRRVNGVEGTIPTWQTVWGQ